MFDLKIEEFANLWHRLLDLLTTQQGYNGSCTAYVLRCPLGYQYFAEPPFLVKVWAVVTGLGVYSRSGK